MPPAKTQPKPAAAPAAPVAAAPVAAAPQARPEEFKVKNISGKKLNLNKGGIEDGKTGVITNAEYTYLHQMVDIV